LSSIFWYCSFAQTLALNGKNVLADQMMIMHMTLNQTSDSGYIIAGSTLSSNGDVTSNHGKEDFWVVK